MLIVTVILEYKYTDRGKNRSFSIEWLVHDSKVKIGA